MWVRVYHEVDVDYLEMWIIEFMTYFSVVCWYLADLIPIIHSSKCGAIFWILWLNLLLKVWIFLFHYHASIWTLRLRYIVFYVVLELWQKNMMSKIALPWFFNQEINGIYKIAYILWRIVPSFVILQWLFYIFPTSWFLFTFYMIHNHHPKAWGPISEGFYFHNS